LDGRWAGDVQAGQTRLQVSIATAPVGHKLSVTSEMARHAAVQPPCAAPATRRPHPEL
jgi:hypothetical protein